LSPDDRPHSPSWERILPTSLVRNLDEYVWRDLRHAQNRVYGLIEYVQDLLEDRDGEPADWSSFRWFTNDLPQELTAVFESMDDDGLYNVLLLVEEWSALFDPANLYGHLVLHHRLAIDSMSDQATWLALHRDLHMKRGTTSGSTRERWDGLF